MSHGYNLLATYTWSHALDNAPTPLGTSGDWGYRASNIIPLRDEWSQSGFDTRHRITFNGGYQLPFGKGRAYLNQNSIVDAVVGGWSANATFIAQTGNFFTVGTSGINTVSGGSARAVKIGDPFKGGGTPDPKAGISACPTSVKNHNNWYNPCAFRNPWNPSDIAGGHYLASGSWVTDVATAKGYLGGKRTVIPGPGYERVNMSIFKSFKTFREQAFEVRADIFNLFNTPAIGEPGNTGIGPNGGQITGLRSFERYAPNSRFLQLSAKYSF